MPKFETPATQIVEPSCVAMTTRYKPVGPEGEFEPGSRGRVLRNRLGIRSIREMERRESAALLRATEHMIDATRADQRFSANDIRSMHKVWLGEIYEWAGEYRHVNIAKGGFMFAAADCVPRLMQELSSGPLKEYTPCNFSGLEMQARALAVVHAELLLIHPFRDGNGRCARLLSTLMGLQAGLRTLDPSSIRGIEKRRYIAAIHAAFGKDYAPMERVFRRVIESTFRR
jgi:cell filamentation protein